MKNLALSAAFLAPVIATAEEGWRQLPSLPDPVGFGGMFAGVMHGNLLVGGGSRFADRPLWQGGQKTYSEKIYVLSDPWGVWVESELRLPKKLGHFATAARDNAIYLVGGLSADGAESLCFGLMGGGGAIETKPLASLPQPLTYAVAGVVGDRLIVAGGQTEAGAKNASREVWSLNVSEPGAIWRREADLPGPGVIVAAAGVLEGRFYLFGGLGYDEAGRPVPSDQAYRYDVATGRWTILAELSEPRVGAVSPCPVLEDGRFLIAGGYDTVFAGEAREHPGFSRRTLLYDPKSGTWETGPLYPMSPVEDRDAVSDRMACPPAAAAGACWRGNSIIVGGETRPSVRTPVVLAWSRP